ncbi:hypothetical protein PG999_006726 [Apiospora kogelbergensis]|uniref:DUF7708 domain-containing protein n=1 Tax=Apiospora kogelbergensis TaxID=1337665 RepID=A0AAW0QWA6_9PEZI
MDGSAHPGIGYKSVEKPSPILEAGLPYDAFEVAKVRFQQALGRDEDKARLVDSTQSLYAMQEMTKRAMEKYETCQSGSEVKKWLQSFSQKVIYYSDILDVFVQHHPEYAALLWGTMKLLFTAFVNHEKTIVKLAKGLSLIADRLPQVELLLSLYPTDRMRMAVAMLNAHVMRFLIRAHDWYLEGAWKHAVHSLTRPYKLRYEDLLDAIAVSTSTIRELASCEEQVNIDTLRKDVVQVNMKLGNMDSKLENMAMAITLTISTNSKTTDLQFSQIMRSISNSAILTPDKIIHYLQFQATRPRQFQASPPTLSRRFIHSPRLRRWDDTDSSAITIVRGNFRCRQSIRTFCWDLIQQLQINQVPILFALKIPLQETLERDVTSTDVLKYLIRQALQMTQCLHTESSMALTCTRFQSNLCEDDLFQILEAVLSEIPGSVYILVDLELLSKGFGPWEGFSWLQAFLGFFALLAQRKPAQRIKVMLLAYSTDFPFALSDQDKEDYVLKATSEGRTARRWRAKRGSAKDPKRRGRFEVRKANVAKTLH